MAVTEPDAMVMGFVYPAGTFFITGFRQKVQKPKTPSQVTFHGRAILRHGPFFSHEVAFNPNTAELTTERTENTEDDLFMMRWV
jgi:hypothetical protein